MLLFLLLLAFRPNCGGDVDCGQRSADVAITPTLQAAHSANKGVTEAASAKLWWELTVAQRAATAKIF